MFPNFKIFVADVLYVWNIFILILTFVGLVFTAFDLYQFRTSIIGWWKSQRDFANSVFLLNTADYFIAHIIQIGGEGSILYSLVISVNEEGGYFLNPPSKFVGIGFNRPVDLMVVTPSEFVSKYGCFVLDSVGPAWDKLESVSSSDICHLPLIKMRNEYFVKFVKRLPAR